MDGNAEAAAHADAVNETDIRFRIAGDGAVESIFLSEEALGLREVAGQHLGPRRADVAARAEGAALAFHHHRFDRVIVAP
jgi:hypothetical protein